MLNISVFSTPFTGTPRPFTLSVTTHDGTAGMSEMIYNTEHDLITTVVSPDDYGGVIGQLIQFNTGDTNQIHTILIEQDNFCEINPNELFFSNITLVSGVQPIDVIRSLATVFIDDTMEPECSELFTQTHHSCHFTSSPSAVHYLSSYSSWL